MLKVLEELIFEGGFDLFGKLLFELKFPPKPPIEQKPKKEDEQQEANGEDR